MDNRRIRKSHAAKLKRSWWRSKIFWSLAGVLIITGAIIYNILFSPFFQAGEIIISGSKEIAAPKIENFVLEQLLRRTFVFSTRSIFVVNTDNLEKELQHEFTQIASVNLKKKFPDGLLVNITEREPAALWCKNACFIVDDQGVAFKGGVNDGSFSVKDERDVPGELERLGQKVLSAEMLSGILKTREFLKNNLQIDAFGARILSDGKFNVQTSEGWEVFISVPADIPWQMTRLKLVLDEEIPSERRPELEYVDLRFSKVYYRYR